MKRSEKSFLKIMACCFALISVMLWADFFDELRDGNLGHIQSLIDKDAGLLNLRNKNNLSPLAFSIDLNRPELVKLLLDKGADAKGRYGLVASLLERAINLKNEKIVALLLNAGADPNEIVRGMEYVLSIAVKNNSPQIVDLLIKAGADVNAESFPEGAPLCVAVHNNNEELVKLLLCAGARVNREGVLRFATRYSALAKAFDNNNEKIAELLLNVGAESNLFFLSSGKSFLQKSLEWGNKKISRLLLQKGARQGRQMLAQAIRNKDEEAIALLLSEGIPIEVSFLQEAQQVGDEKITGLLLSNIKDEAMEKFLFTALDKKNEKVLEFLLSTGGNRKNPLSNESVFVSFTNAKEDNGFVLNAALKAISSRLTTIVTRSMFLILYEHIRAYVTTKQLSIFTDESKNLYILIPEFIENNEQLRQKYGFCRVHYMMPLAIESAEKNSLDNSDKKYLLECFRTILDNEGASHPLYFFLTGHGDEKLIAEIPFMDFEIFLNFLDNIAAKFLYISTCCAGGQHILNIQSELSAILAKNMKRQGTFALNAALNVPYRKPFVDYMIGIQATTDGSVFEHGDMRNFFDHLERYFSHEQDMLAGKKKKQDNISMVEVIRSLRLSEIASLPSIRFPGTAVFFRAVDLGNMEIITWNKLQALRLQSLNVLDIARLTHELDLLRQKEFLMEMKDFENKEKRLMEEIVQARKLAKEGVKISLDSPKKYLQIFPSNLMNCTIELNSNDQTIISKMVGQAFHFIEKLIYRGTKEDFLKRFELGIDDLLLTPKYWFIKSLELTSPLQTRVIVKRDLSRVTMQELDVAMAKTFMSKLARSSSDEEVVSILYEMLGENVPEDKTKAIQAINAILYEATGGQENFNVLKQALIKFLE